VLELKAAVKAILENAQPEEIVIIITDNTAAACVLKTMYSSTAKGRKLLAKLYAFMKTNRITLVVVSIPDPFNDADSPTRHDPPIWNEERRLATWNAGVRALEGGDKEKLNPIGASFSHRQDEVSFEPRRGELEQLTTDEDLAFECDGITAACEEVMRETCI